MARTGSTTVAAMFAALVLSAAAAAADIHVTADVKPGSMTLSAMKELASAGTTADGQRLRRFQVTVVDARGSGAGWRLEARPAGAGIADRSVKAVEVRCAEKSTCTLPRPSSIPATLAAGRRTVVLASEQGTGMGKIEVILTIAIDGGGGTAPVAFSLKRA
jgi:hypothetical protein